MFVVYIAKPPLFWLILTWSFFLLSFLHLGFLYFSVLDASLIQSKIFWLLVWWIIFNWNVYILGIMLWDSVLYLSPLFSRSSLTPLSQGSGSEGWAWLVNFESGEVRVLAPVRSTQIPFWLGGVEVTHYCSPHQVDGQWWKSFLTTRTSLTPPQSVVTPRQG